VTTYNLAAVTNLLVAGHSVTETAERLGITHGQARYAEKLAMQRAGVRRRGELMRAHGNADPVVPHPNRTPVDVQRAIVARRAAGETNKAIALRYGLSESGVSRICTRAQLALLSEVRCINEHAAKELAEMEAV
jgi:DNA-binding CsgD family transcriptional regulator